MCSRPLKPAKRANGLLNPNSSCDLCLSTCGVTVLAVRLGQDSTAVAVCSASRAATASRLIRVPVRVGNTNPSLPLGCSVANAFRDAVKPSARLFRPECSHEMSQAARPAHRALAVPRGRRTRCCVPAIHASRQEVRERCFVASSGKVRVAGAARCTRPDLPSDGVGIEGGMLLGEPLQCGFVTDIVTVRSDRGMGVNKT